jgi:PAS domain S-box-containing protein
MSASTDRPSSRPHRFRALELTLAGTVLVAAIAVCIRSGTTVGALLAGLLGLGWIGRSLAGARRTTSDAGLPRPVEPSAEAQRAEAPRPEGLNPSAHLTRSGIYLLHEFPSDAGIDPTASGEWATTEMVNRLDPSNLRWLESSPAEQAFLGWPIGRLRSMSFLEIVRHDQRELAREQIRSAIDRGEALGLIYGIRNSQGQPRAIEVNVGARYGTDGSISHLRCHLTDVTERLQADRDLRRRTRQLTLVNEQLRRANAELNELKERFSDLYQNAPVMYFSLDPRGRFLDVNDTMVRTLGFAREQLVGRPYSDVLPEPLRARFPERFEEYLRIGELAVESRWRDARGGQIDVWISATACRDDRGTMTHSRSVATDITAKKALESKIQETNERLARLNEELTRKNHELDDFGRVVSHDLRQPIRTVIGFAELLLSDHADRLDEQGQDYLRYMAGASRRMRALVESLLSHGRAGRVVGECGPVDLGPIIDSIRADHADLLRQRGGTIEVVGPLPSVLGDRERLLQLFSNLIGNGLKFNRGDRPRVEVSATLDPEGGWAEIAVRDNGIGIDPRYHDAIFQIFRRLHAEDDYEGTGAGLAICRKIVQALGGTIGVESEPDRGSTFRVRLRCEEAGALQREEEAAGGINGRESPRATG